MNRGLLYRILLVLGLTVVAIVYLLPTFVTSLPGFWPDRRVRLGLDLQGGMHLVLAVEVDRALENTVERTAADLERELRTKQVASAAAERTETTALRVVVPDSARATLEEILSERFPDFEVAASTVSSGNAEYTVRLRAAEESRLRQSAVDQSLETIRNRIDQFGVAEPIIQRQGETDIVVQLPGVQDPQRAKELIGRTAVLEFKLVREGVNPADYVDGTKPLPTGTQLLYTTQVDQFGERRKGDPLVVESRTLMTGDLVTDARVRPGELPGERVVTVDFNSRGARLFEELTGANVQRRLAIILDQTIYSAPVIRERIGGGSARITGNFEFEEAKDLAIVLRTGALPAPVSVAEERTVGPSLGRDSIRQGILSFVVGGTLVLVFMLFYYKWAGALADLALIFNITYLVAALAAFEATLTLPGIAGIVLTLGMAVDANVLIAERIREELRIGKTARAAIEAGYERALPAILDSNVTTFLAGLILFQFGSGPIKGFAVTLCIGLATSVFTAIVGTRVVYDYILSKRRLQTVSI